jgi:hypothetical protein
MKMLVKDPTTASINIRTFVDERAVVLEGVNKRVFTEYNLVKFLEDMNENLYF